MKLSSLFGAVGLLIAIAAGVAACVETQATDPSIADIREAKQTKSLTERAAQAVGMPAIVNFTEKKRVKRIYEKRDDAKLVTYTYLRSLDGGLFLLCKSLGFGVNASIQFSNPQAYFKRDGGEFYQDMPSPQAEPNGLFMPEGLASTYVECITDSKTGETSLVYIEDPIIVSEHALQSAAAY